MKRVCFLFVVVFCCINFYGQAWDNAKPDRRFTFGIRAGANFSSTAAKEWVASEWIPYEMHYYRYNSFKSKLGFHAGLNVDINIIKSFAVETGLYYTNKVFTGEETTTNESETFEFQYIQLPVLALFRLYIEDDMHIQLKGGVYCGSPFKIPSLLNGHWPDAGIMVGAGVNYKKYYFGVQYEMGMTTSRFEDSGKCSNLSISVGYDF